MKANSSWLKRTLAMLLVVVTLVGLIPTSVIASAAESLRNSSYIPGDVNGDGDVNAMDVNLLRRYIVGGYDVTINLLAADVNADGDINAQDVNNIRRHIAGGYGIELQPGLVPTYSVKFYDGDRLIDTLTAEKNQPLGAVPSVEKSSKANAILLGYFTDPECTQPFYAENPVTGDMNVYAKYEEMGSTEELNFTSFAQMDQTPDLSFEVVGTGDPSQAITLEVKDGSAPVELKFEATDGGYIVSAPEGFNEGASYQLHLADGWNFKDKPDTIRTASFSIEMEEVDNLEMNEDIVYIKDTDSIVYNIGGQNHDVLTSSLITENGGSFTYPGAGNEVATGDIICLYVGTNPEERVGNSDVLDPAVYVKVSDVSGDTVTFTQLSDEEQQELYKIPANFPLNVPALPTGDTGTVNISALDKEAFVMTGEDYTVTNALDKAKELIAVGDFISMYVSTDSISSEADVYFGEITGYNVATGEITYKRTTRQAIIDSMNLFADIDLKGSDLVSEEEKAALEGMLLTQVENSGFAEDAAFMLADLVTKTNGFQNNATIQDLVITDANGNPLTDEQIQLLNIGGSFELSDDIKLTVELITKGDQLHFDGGVQLAVGVEAEFEVEVEDDGKIKIELSATFVQEVMLDPTIDGEMLFYELFGCIPVPNGVRVGASIDIMNFTAFAFDAKVYTVAAEDKPLWEQLQDVLNNPEKLADIEGLPSELSAGLKTAGDVIDKIEELQDDVAELKSSAESTANQVQAYMDDIALLWGTIDHVIKEEDYSAICEALGQTNVTSDLLDMMNLTTETGLSTEYYDSVQALLDRYCEMLEQESDWVTLVEKEIFQKEVSLKAMVIGIEAKFLVHADMSLAIGSNLEYEVGKRYEFWFKIGLFKPSAGGSSMDLIDERFAFQFYVMGRLGVKAGVRAKFYVGIGTGDVANVGITAELGPYVKLYGFFVYENTKYRPANTDDWTVEERMMGALYVDFGLYFILGVEAEAVKLFEYSFDLVDEEYQLLEAGDKRFYYGFDFAPEEDEVVLVNDVDSNSNNGITMQIPQNLLALNFINLTTGGEGVRNLDYKDIHFTVSNPNFAIDDETGVITVTVPEGTRYMECDLTATYKYGKMAFSTYDMSVTIPLVWTNLSTDELSEYYTASVRIGNNEDGYETVWTKRVLKGQEFDLPTVEELKELIGWNDYKYVMGTGYGSQQLEDLTLIEDEVYDFNLDYKTYSVTVNGVQNANGSTGSRTYYAAFGETFDFSDLFSTGTNSGDVYTRFIGMNPPAGIDLAKAIDTRMAAALEAGATATALYNDNSVTATFTFVGIDAEEVVIKLRRGDIPTLASIDAIVAEHGMAIKEIYPAIGAVNGSTTYQVVCGELDTAPATITFVENGGSNVDDITKPYGSLIGTLPTPNKTGHTFGGWYTDEALTQLFTETKMPEGGIALYAKWTAKQYTVTFNENGGDALADDEMTVTYGTAYGELPKANRTGYGFAGWFTAATGGNQITAQSIYAIDGDQTLYAQWRELKDISRDVFDFGSAESFTYEKSVSRETQYTFTAASGETYKANEFTIKYKRQGSSEYEAGLPINAGTYDVTVSRAADNTYAKFEETYTSVLIINKATLNISSLTVTNEGCGLFYIKAALANPSEIPDVDEDVKISFSTTAGGTTVVSPAGNAEDTLMIEGLSIGQAYTVKASVTNMRNYEDITVNTTGASFTTKAKPSDYWDSSDNYDISWYDESATEYVIDTPAELAGLIRMVNNKSKDFSGKTIKLGADLDMSAYIWTSIGDDRRYAFAGVFDGQGHTISGLYNTLTDNYNSLFGFVEGTADSYACVKNLVVDDSYFSGQENIAGIVASISDYTIVQNCVNYATIVSSEYQAGGIVAQAFGDTEQFIINCVNYGTISGHQYVGGIVGEDDEGLTLSNNANFGTVTGDNFVAGIGDSSISDGMVTNNYTVGRVESATGTRLGAIIYSVSNSNHVNEYNYYLADSATADKERRYAYGDTPDGEYDRYASTFTSPESLLLETAGKYADMTLIEALNAYVDECGRDDLAKWEATGPDGYPVPVGSPVSALRK